MSTRRPASRVSTPVPESAPVSSSAENGANGARNSVNLGPNDRLVGQLYIEGDLRITGTVDGDLEATGDIEISGDGKVSGTVTAYNRLMVRGKASLIGSDVRVGRLSVEDGATFSGHVSMGKAAVEAPPRPVAVVAAPVAEPEPAPAELEPMVEMKAPEPEPAPVVEAPKAAVVVAEPPKPKAAVAPAKIVPPVKQASPVKQAQPVKSAKPAPPPPPKGKRR